jgi:cell wall-associated NlpC family hydrolase
VGRALLACVVVAVLAVSTLPAEAQTRRRRPGTLKVALQPFSLVREAVHAVADPIVENAPRAITRVATAPVRIAATTARMLPRGEENEDDEYSDQPGEEVYPAERVRAAQPVRSAASAVYGEPVRVAYVTAQPVRRAEPAPQADAYDEGIGFEGEAPRDEQGFADEADEESAQTPEISWPGDRPTVPGTRAVLRNGIAYAPSHAPQNVKNAIWAVNALRRKPYRWGGGHASFHDRGYDCSGAVSYALHYAGVLASPMPSTGFLSYGRRGRGRWITVYSRPGHTFAIIAGLRLDTTDFQRGGNTGPRWHVDGRDTDDFVARHPAGL